MRIKYGTIFSFKVPRVVLPQIRQRSVAPLPSLDRNEAHTESLPSLAAPGYLIQTCDRRARGTRGPVASRPLLLRRLCLLVILALSLCHRKVSRDTHRSRDLANNTSSCFHWRSRKSPCDHPSVQGTSSRRRDRPVNLCTTDSYSRCRRGLR